MRKAIQLFNDTKEEDLQSLVQYLNSIIGSDRPDDHAELIKFGSKGKHIIIGTDHTEQEYQAMKQEVEDLTS